MKSKKIIAGLILSATLLTANTSAFAAKESQAMWKKNDTGWWYENANGSYPQSEWKKINGSWYYFGNDGYMLESQWIGNYYVGTNGAMLVNTTTPDGYKVDENGKWIEENKENKTTNTYVNGIFYDENKKPANWWYDDGTGWFFFKDGKKLTGEGTDANGSHYFINGKYANGDFKNAFYENGKVKYYKNGKYKNTLVYKNHVIEIGAFRISDEVKAYASRSKDGKDYQAYLDDGHVLVSYHPLDLTDGKGSKLTAHAGMNFRPLWENLKNGEIITIYDIHGNYANFKMKLDITISNDDIRRRIAGKEFDHIYNLAQKEENIQIGFCRTLEYQESWLGEICN